MITVLVNYPSEFLNVVESDFPEFLQAANEGEFELGRKICNQIPLKPHRHTKLLSLFHTWCSLPVILDETTRILIS
jgi:hypothetical protein